LPDLIEADNPQRVGQRGGRIGKERPAAHVVEFFSARCYKVDWVVHRQTARRQATCCLEQHGHARGVVVGAGVVRTPGSEPTRSKWAKTTRGLASGCAPGSTPMMSLACAGPGGL